MDCSLFFYIIALYFFILEHFQNQTNVSHLEEDGGLRVGTEQEKPQAVLPQNHHQGTTFGKTAACTLGPNA